MKKASLLLLFALLLCSLLAYTEAQHGSEDWTVEFTETFSTPGEIGLLEQPVSADTSWVDGGYAVVLTGTPEARYDCLLGRNFTDLSVGLRFRFVEGAGHVAVVVRARPDESTYYVVFATTRGLLSLNRVDDGDTSELQEVTLPSEPGTQLHSILFRARGEILSVFWDGELAVVAEDHTIGSGVVQMSLVGEDGKPFACWLDDIEVRAAPRPDYREWPLVYETDFGCESQAFWVSKTTESVNRTRCVWREPDTWRSWPVVFSDEFGDPGSSWLETGFEGVSFSHLGSAWQVSLAGASTIWISEERTKPGSGGSRVELEARAVDGSGAFGLIFRYTDPKNYYCFLVSTTQRYRLFKIEEGTPFTIAEWLPSTLIRPSESNRITVIDQEGCFAVYLNDEYILGHADPEFPSGMKIRICAAPISSSSTGSAFSVRLESFAIYESSDIEDAGQSNWAFSQRLGAERSLAWHFVPSVELNGDFSVEVETRVVDGVGAESGILFCYRDGDNYHRFRVNTSGEYSLDKKHGGQWQSLIPWTFSAAVRQDDVNRLALAVERERISLFCNGVLLYDYVDSSAAGGRIALYVGTGDVTPARAVYRNLSVRSQTARLARHADAERALALAEEAAELERAGDTEAAIALLEEALSLFEALEWKTHRTDTLVELADCLGALGEYDRSTHYGELAAEALEERPNADLSERKLLHVELGIGYLMLGDARNSSVHLHIALALDHENGPESPWVEASILNVLGHTALLAANPSVALDYLEQAWRWYQIAEPTDYADEEKLLVRKLGCLRSLALCHLSLGNIIEASSCVMEMIDLAKVTLIRLSASESGEIVVLSQQEGPSKATIVSLSVGEEGVVMSSEDASFDGERFSIFVLNEVWVEGQDDPIYVVTPVEEGNPFGGEIYSIFALIRFSEGDFETTLDCALEALRRHREMGDRDGEMNALLQLGHAYLELGQTEEARDSFFQVLALCSLESQTPVLLQPTIEWAVYDGLAELSCRSGDSGTAIEWWGKAADTIEASRAENALMRAKIRYFADKLHVYHRLVQALISEEDVRTALHYAERAKAKTLVDMMETAMVTRRDILLPDLQTASHVLGELSGLQGAIDEPDLAAIIGPSEARSSLARAQQSTEAEYDAILEELEREHPELSETLSVNPERLWEHFEYAQGELGEGTVALEYFVTAEETILWVITQDGVQTANHIAVSREELTAKVRDFQEKISSPPPSKEGATALRSVMESGQDLYDLLIAPVEEYLKGAEQLVIVPSDALFYLPFGALYVCPECEGPDLLGGEFFIEQLPISYAPSLSSLYWPFQHRGDGVYESVLSVGNPTGDLEHAKEGAEAVAALFPRSTTLLGAQATEAAVKQALGTETYDVVHLSTHGLFDPVVPLLSQVVLCGGDGEDGALYAGEILGLPLSVELVVLSACQTALPPELTEETAGLVVGDEIQGLGQALFVAGAPSAVLTLWNVNDRSTRYLMEDMYQELMEGKAKGQALQQAQLALLEDENGIYSHPCYWAPFVLYGDWR